MRSDFPVVKTAKPPGTRDPTVKKAPWRKGERVGDREFCAADTRDHRRFTAKAPGSAVGAREIGWPSFHFSQSDIKHKQKGPRRWNKALMSRRLFSLEGTGSARANPWRYEIPVRMCLEWLVVRPLASIKPTAELLLVMPDILTALRGAGAGADTPVFEVKHTVGIRHLHNRTHTGYFLQTHPQLLCWSQRFCQLIQIRTRNCWTNNRLTIRAFALFFFSVSSRRSEIDCWLGRPMCSVNNTN